MALETIHREHLIKGLPPSAVYDVVVDYACYPRIFPEYSGVRVLVDGGARKRVEFRTKVIVDVRYVLDIVHDWSALTARWTFVEGEVVSDSEGGWALSGDERGTLVKYDAGLAIKAPLPKLLVNKISNALIGSNIPSMFRALEREALARRRYAVGAQ